MAEKVIEVTPISIRFRSMADCIARGFPTICPGNDDVAESPGELPDLPGRKDGVARDDAAVGAVNIV